MAKVRLPAGPIARIRRLSPGKLAAGIVLAGVLLQVWVLYGEYISPWSRRIWDIRAKAAWERSGILSPWFGEERTEFLGFVKSQTSEESVLIFAERSGPYGWRPVLQYFLFPRRVVVCIGVTLVDCIQPYLGDASFVVILEGRPELEILPAGAIFIPYKGDVRNGLYPLGSFGSTGPSGTEIP